MLWSSATSALELPDQAAARRGAAGVDDPAGAVSALEAEGEAALTVCVEADAQPDQVFDRHRRLVAQDPRG